MRVYRKISEHFETCQFGQEHVVHVWAGKDIEPTGDTWTHDFGYGGPPTIEKIYSDRRGNIYKQYSPFDYSGGVYYTTEWRGTIYHFTTHMYGCNVDVLGRKI